MSLVDGIQRDLSYFSPGSFEVGRPRAVLVVWFALLHLVFMRWWFPRSGRPHVLRMFGAEVGAGVDIRENVYIHFPWRLVLGERCAIGRDVMIINHESVVLEGDCMVSQRAVLTSGGHDPRTIGLDYLHRTVKLRRGTWVCACAVVLPGVITFENEVVGAGQVRSRRGES